MSNRHPITYPDAPLYQSFIPISQLKTQQMRIYDPFAYRVTHRQRFVPVSMNEAFGLAEYYPVVWIRNEIGDLNLHVLRGLREDQPIASAQTLGLFALPLLLQAFPLRFRSIQSGDYEIGVERTAPERERDQGAYVFNHEGEFLPGAELKLAALEAFKTGDETLRELTQVIGRLNGFEPVKLPEAMVEENALPDFFAARENLDLDMVLARVPEHQLATAIRFLTAQRLSLYRMAAVINASKAAA